jgi:ribosomal protein S18 acetylase RimI-like enzyme
MAVQDPVTISGGGTDVDWVRVSALFDSVGWAGRKPQALREAFASSSVVRFAYGSGGQLVGVCRAITDGVLYALVVDLVVSPGFQRQGIGRRLLTSVCDALRGVRQVHLLSTRGNEAFYDKAGFDRQLLQAFVRPNKPASPPSDSPP